MGKEFDLSKLIKGKNEAAERIAQRINLYLLAVSKVLEKHLANSIFPWSASRQLKLPPFGSINGFSGRTGIIGHMDFLHGIATAAKMEFFKLGNGDWNTDYRGKGEKLIELTASGYEFIYCHINAPDECSHMGDLERKVNSLEEIDREIVGPLQKYLDRNMDKVGGIAFTTDHYTNHFPRKDDITRSETHSIHPSLFVFGTANKKMGSIVL